MNQRVTNRQPDASSCPQCAGRFDYVSKPVHDWVAAITTWTPDDLILLVTNAWCQSHEGLVYGGEIAFATDLLDFVVAHAGLPDDDDETSPCARAYQFASAIESMTKHTMQHTRLRDALSESLGLHPTLVRRLAA